MKTQIKSLVALLLSALSGFINQNERRRITVGLSLSVGSFLYTFFVFDLTGNGNPGAFPLYILLAWLFILGLVLITQSMDLVSKFFTRFALELAGLCIFCVSVKYICSSMLVSVGEMKGLQPLLLLAAFLVATFYIARVSLFIYLLLKKVYTMVVDKLKVSGEKIQSRTELFDRTLKNLVSIAGTLALIYNFLMPMIKMFM